MVVSPEGSVMRHVQMLLLMTLRCAYVLDRLSADNILNLADCNFAAQSLGF